ncbi:CubicO group peptidase (beta-lactamase class C family) [Stackebrandtia albiflava]|uniref:CubicO group peptidase (Beta-lactamase class C family) n=1 Tax=Stackebrandtia albiflava TaxID=406432 RepID=A0A562VC72_9ACTN|nr:serine hydrolase domain-containing protein [Stackebrandtia albiflava]TWJ15479.1 CubicO group peptidase (beta-lactamase class C family) [Stackebrandtia albiflava]
MNDREVRGTVEDGFAGVRDVYAEVVAAHEAPVDSQLAVYLRGRPVVDLWAGPEATGTTLTAVYSSTKGAATVVAALLAQEGVLDLDVPVAAHWPEFAAAGKSAITVRDVLTHRSGLIGVDDGFTAEELVDDAGIARRLAPQRPFWRHGTGYGYGGFVTFAMLSEVVRRITGQTLQQVYEERVRIPYDLDLHLGLPESEEPRFLPVRRWTATPEQEAAFWRNVPGPYSITGIGYGLDGTPPLDQVAFANARSVRAHGQASAGGVGSARGLARLYAAAVWGVDGAPPLLSAETVAEFSQLHCVGGDLVRGPDGAYALGFQAKGLRYPFLSAKAFGHDGSAGSESFADPRSGIAFGYTRRSFGFGWSYPEHDRLAAAVHDAVTSR